MVALLKSSLSQWKPPLRLVRDEEEAFPATKASERRIFPRKEVRTQVVGKRLDHALPALRQPALNLSLRDLSVGGLSALTEMPLLPGERIAVNFPAQGLQMGWGACGRVLRCEPSAMGYRIAVEFEAIPSAA